VSLNCEFPAFLVLFQSLFVATKLKVNLTADLISDSAKIQLWILYNFTRK